MLYTNYGKKKLLWFGDKSKTLNYSSKSDEMILTVHLSEDTEYYHLIRDDSLEGNVSFESCLEGIRALEKRIEAFADHDFPDKTEEYLRSTVNYYIGRFNKADKEQKDEELKQSNRKLFKEKLDAALSVLPESMNVTEGLKSYEELCHREDSFDKKE